MSRIAERTAERIAAEVERGVEALGSIAALARACGISMNTLITWRKQRALEFQDKNLAKLARGLRRGGIRVSLEYLQTGRTDDADAHAVGYESLRQFLAEFSAQVTAQEVAFLDAVDFGAEGDIATIEWWSSLLLLYRRALARTRPAAP